ncbi:MAG TPA: hypothetical protein VD905_15880 [Flavobacteriales bacterium]|nr:hypothetical protein [Flavobacteriales bacterium]
MSLTSLCLAAQPVRYGTAGDSTARPLKKTKPVDDLRFWDHCYSGGDLMFYGGNGSVYFNISPMLGYRPANKSFSYGIGTTYQYSSFTYLSGNNISQYRFSLVGIRGFLRQDISKMFFLHGELENYFTKGRNIFTRKDELISFACANAFIGFKQMYSDFSYYYIMAGYEFLGDGKAGIYAYPLHPFILKAGYVFDLKGK